MDKRKIIPTKPRTADASFEKEKTVRLLKGLLGKKRGVLLAVVFGSFVSGGETAAGDIDIGILFKEDPDFNETAALKSEMETVLKKEADIAVLNSASPVLKMQVLKNGIVVLDRKGKYFSRFFIETVNQYDDLKRVRKECEENIMRGRIYA